MHISFSSAVEVMMCAWVFDVHSSSGHGSPTPTPEVVIPVASAKAGGPSPKRIFPCTNAAAAA